MEKSKFPFILGLCGIMVLAIFAFLASQLLPASAVSQQPPSVEPDQLAQQQQRIPTPVGAVTKAPYSQPLPTRANDKSNATPTLIPPTRVQRGTVTEIQPQDMPPLLHRTLGPLPGQPIDDKYPVVTQDSTRRYQVHNGTQERSGSEGSYKFRRLFVRDARTGQEVRLGNDDGNAIPSAITDQYLLWWFRCYEECDTNPIKSGLYIYDFRAGSNTRLGEMVDQHDLRADGRWIGYVKPTSGPGVDKPTTYVQRVAGCFGDLYIYNLDTKQERFVDSTVPWECRADSGFLHSATIGWYGHISMNQDRNNGLSDCWI